VVTWCEYVGGEAEAREPEEVAAVHWLEPAAIEAHPDAPAYLLADVERLAFESVPRRHSSAATGDPPTGGHGYEPGLEEGPDTPCGE